MAISNDEKHSHYGEKYYAWQKTVSEFGGSANAFKFRDTIIGANNVIDFGCGGGFLLSNLECEKKVGIEPNIKSHSDIRNNGAVPYESPKSALHELGPEWADLIISNNALEHVADPLSELKSLYPLLRSGGLVHFVVPCENISMEYREGDINRHLFSWSPMCLGNLFDEAGYNVIYSRKLIHKWPPGYRNYAKLGWAFFHLSCKIYGRIERSWFQVEVLAEKRQKD